MENVILKGENLKIKGVKSNLDYTIYSNGDICRTGTKKVIAVADDTVLYELELII